MKNCRIQNPDIPRAGRVGARGGSVGPGRTGRGSDRTARLVNNCLSHPPSHQNTSPERLSKSTNKSIFYINRFLIIFGMEGLQRQGRIGLLVSIQERIAAVAPLIHGE